MDRWWEFLEVGEWVRFTGLGYFRVGKDVRGLGGMVFLGRVLWGEKRFLEEKGWGYL